MASLDTSWQPRPGGNSYYDAIFWSERPPLSNGYYVSMSALSKDQVKLEIELKKMKCLLIKKEKRLNKYNKVLSSKRHVRETILKHKSEQTGSNISDFKEEETEDTSSSVSDISLKRKRSVTFQDNESFSSLEMNEVDHSTKVLSLLNGKNITTICINEENNNISQDISVSLAEVSNLKRKPVDQGISIQNIEYGTSLENKITELSKEDTRQVPSSFKVSSKISNVRMDFAGFSSINPVGKHPEKGICVFRPLQPYHAMNSLSSESERKIKCMLGLSRKRQPVKMLFSEINESFINKSKLSENKNISTVLSNEFKNETKDHSSFISLENTSPDDDLDSKDHIHCLVVETAENLKHSGSLSNSSSYSAKKTPAENILEGSKDYSQQNMNIGDSLKQTKNLDKSNTEKCLCLPIKSQEHRTKETLNYESLNEKNLGKICASSLSYRVDGFPTLLLIGTTGFSIWALVEDENLSSNGTDFVWKRSCFKETDIFQSLSFSHFCVLGGGSKQETNFIIVQSPTNTGSLKIIVLHHSLLNNDIKIVRSSTSVSVCADCSFCGCRSQPWEFYLYIQPCLNEGCFNINSGGVLLHTSFDLLYSHRTETWELVLCINRRLQLDGNCLVAINPLWNCGSVPGINSEEQLVLCQDSSGLLGLTDGLRTFPLASSSLSNVALRKTVAAGVLLYAAVIKEFLLLILKEEESYRFLAVNPLNGQFDDFYQIKFSNLNTSWKTAPTVIFYKKKFFFLTPEAVVISFSIS